MIKTLLSVVKLIIMMKNKTITDAQFKIVYPHTQLLYYIVH